jgi:hypothetical protein
MTATTLVYSTWLINREEVHVTVSGFQMINLGGESVL